MRTTDPTPHLPASERLPGLMPVYVYSCAAMILSERPLVCGTRLRLRRGRRRGRPRPRGLRASRCRPGPRQAGVGTRHSGFRIFSQGLLPFVGPQTPESPELPGRPETPPGLSSDVFTSLPISAIFRRMRRMILPDLASEMWGGGLFRLPPRKGSFHAEPAGALG